MKIGEVIKSNSKGQIVIPKEYRDKLGIKPQTNLNTILKDGMIIIVPISEVISDQEDKPTFKEILQRTRGAWGPETNEVKRERIERRKRGLERTKIMKKAW